MADWDGKTDRVSLIRRWLMQGEKPVYVDAIDAHSERKTIIWRHGMTWIAWARTLDACNPASLEAYDAGKTIIRATTLVNLDKVDPEDLQDERPSINGAMRGPLSSNEQMLCTMGQLISEAYKTAAVTMCQTFVENAFNKMADLFEAVTRRSESQDKALAELERALQRQSDLLTRATEGIVAAEGGSSGSLLEQMVAAYAQGQAQAAAQAPTNGKTNGKGKQI
jgi:hypothetical protein